MCFLSFSFFFCNVIVFYWSSQRIIIGVDGECPFWDANCFGASSCEGWIIMASMQHAQRHRCRGYHHLVSFCLAFFCWIKKRVLMMNVLIVLSVSWLLTSDFWLWIRTASGFGLFTLLSSFTLPPLLPSLHSFLSINLYQQNLSLPTHLHLMRSASNPDIKGTVIFILYHVMVDLAKLKKVAQSKQYQNPIASSHPLYTRDMIL